MHRLIFILLPLLCAARSSFGPPTVRHAQFNYNGAITDASREQLLVNLVRLRYSESPSFLKVSSVISQYTRAARVDATFGANTSALGGNTAGIGGNARWSDRPVITYVPVTGKEFSQALLTPLQPKRLFEMMQAGWPADLAIRMAILSVNNIGNEVARPARRRQAHPAYYEMLELWQALGQAELVQLRHTEKNDGTTRMTMYIESTDDPTFQANLSRFRDILRLAPDVNEFHLIHSKTRRDDNEIAVQTGSI